MPAASHDGDDSEFHHYNWEALYWAVAAIHDPTDQWVLYVNEDIA